MKRAWGARWGRAWSAALVCAVLLCLGAAAFAQAQGQPGQPGAGVIESDGLVQLDFNDVEIAVVIDTIARLTGRNFIYDDRVRGRVTIVSPTRITIDEAYAVFESVLQVKGFTLIDSPGNAKKVIPIRDAKETNVETLRGGQATPDSDRFITRLIPLRYIDAEAIANTLKPLVSKDASMVAYPATNTVILTDAGTNIARILEILNSIDVETYKEELSVIEIRYADATTLAQQLSEIFDAEVSTTGGGAGGVGALRNRRVATAPQVPGVAQASTAQAAAMGRVRIITDERTNSLIVLASRTRTQDIRDAVAKLDRRVPGGGRIHVYYLKHADAEELAATLAAMISGQPSAPSGGGAGGALGASVPPQVNVQAMRAAVSELAEGVSVTADAPTNSLVIQGSQEAFTTLRHVIEQLDIERPQVLVEALIMEVDVSNGIDLGFSGIARILDSNERNFAIGSVTDTPLGGVTDKAPPGTVDRGLLDALIKAAGDNALFAAGNIVAGETLIQGIIRASASDSGSNILSAPHVLTLDNEEAEIKVGDNIPIITSRVQSAAGVDTTEGLATSQNIERQDVGITLRVTPQISEGDQLRLKIFQEVTAVNSGLTGVTGDPEEVGVALSNRKIENTVVVSDDETIVIGGLIDEAHNDKETKVPFLGDIPFLGWLFKSTSTDSTKRNLLVFLTPHIMRSEAEMALETMRKREEFSTTSHDGLAAGDANRRRAEAAGVDVASLQDPNPVRARLKEHRKRYPLERMRELEEEAEKAPKRGEAAPSGERFGVLAATYGDEGAAAATLQELIAAGYDGSLVTEDRSGTLLYEVRLGPFATREEAEHAMAHASASLGLSPTLTLEPPAEGE